MSSQNCMLNQNWDKTFELQNTTVMSTLLDCQIMNIYCIMKMWWHLEQSHLTLSSCASVSPLSTNAFCSKGCILKDSGRNVSQSRRCLRAGVISDRFLNSGEHTQTRTDTQQGCSILHIPPPPLFFSLFLLCLSPTLNISVGLPLSRRLCWRYEHRREGEAWPVGRCLPPHYQMQMKRVHMFNI